MGERSMELRETDRCQRMYLKWRKREEGWREGRPARGRGSLCKVSKLIKEL